MLNKKYVLAASTVLFINSAFAAVATTMTPAPATKAAAPVVTAPTTQTNNAPSLTLEISTPEALATLAKGMQPNPVYLQYVPNDGTPPIYSDPLIPGQEKSIELKITSVSNNGAQFQIVSSTTGAIQPMSFMYAFTQQRLACLINKNTKLMIIYSINNRLMDVEGIPIDC